MYLIGFFSKRQKFHIVEQRDTMEEVEAYLNNHDYGHFNKLVVFQLVNRPTKRALDLLLGVAESAGLAQPANQ